MPIGTPTERYHSTSQTGVISTYAFSPATTVASGTLAILIECNDGSTGATNLFSSVADNVGGNTWVVDHTYSDNTDSRCISIASCQVVNAITNAKTITITYGGSNNVTHGWWVQEVTGMATSSAFDQAVDGRGAASSSVSVGPTGTLAQAAEIAFVPIAQGSNTGTFTPGSGWTAVTTGSQGHYALEYQITSSTAALTGTATLGTSDSYGAVVIAYKGLASAGGTPAALGSDDPSYLHTLY